MNLVGSMNHPDSSVDPAPLPPLIARPGSGYANQIPVREQSLVL
jgi:hypothetical protein